MLVGEDKVIREDRGEPGPEIHFVLTLLQDGQQCGSSK